MKIWLTTDTHFGHKKLIEFTGRPEGFETKILNNLVNGPGQSGTNFKNGDLLIHLGDFCIGKDADWHQLFMESLPTVRKVLVRGNHDKKSDQWYYEHGWDFVCQNFTLYFQGKRILFSHRPQPDGKFDINIHGHFHNSDHHLHEPELVAIRNSKQKLLAIENTNLMPVTLESFIA